MKSFENFNQELNEIRGITSLTRGLGRGFRAGPAFKASIPKNISTRNLYHGTSSNFANKIKTQGLTSATGSYKNIADYNKKFYTGKSFEPNRAFVTDNRRGAEAYAELTARAENKKFLRRIGLRKKVKPEVVRVTTPADDLRQAVNRNEFTANVKTIQPVSSYTPKNTNPKSANEFLRRTRKGGDLHTA
tara:strand:+ start:42 stop:608 length:567 start_codon:yes stop_codon:yes gene_type:complete